MSKNPKPDLDLDIVNDLASEVIEERMNQFDQWGQQDHPSSYGESLRRQYAREAENAKAINAARVEAGSLSWDGILLEEVFEALGEIDPLLRRAELIQVAAVALGEIEAIDRLIASDDSPYAGEILDEIVDDEVAA